MKVRQGFVSNSSSSSFIIGYGVIEDKQRLLDYLKENEIQLDYDIRLKEKKNSFKKKYNDKEDDYIDEYELWGGNYTSIVVPKNLLDNDLLLVEIHNNEGDQEFWNKDTEELDYDKAKYISFYNKKQQILINLLNDSDIFKNSLIQYGAERNG